MTRTRESSPNAEQPPEGALLRERRTALGLSLAAAGSKIGNSANWWRILERGAKSNGRPFQAPATTYARAALAIGYKAEQLFQAAEASHLTDSQQRRLLLIASEAERLQGLFEGLDASPQPSDQEVTVDWCVIRLEGLLDVCGRETLSTALRRLGWTTPPTSPTTEAHVS